MAGLKLPTLFKQNKAKHFEYRPRYYDERKERLEELHRKYESNPDQEAPKRREIKFSKHSKFENEWSQTRNRQVHSSNRILLLIVMGLFLVAYLIFR